MHIKLYVYIYIYTVYNIYNSLCLLLKTMLLTPLLHYLRTVYSASLYCIRSKSSMQIQHIHFNCVSHFILVLLGHSSALPISSPWLASIHTIPPVMGALFISISKLCLSMTHIQGVGASCASLPLSDNLFHGVVCHQAGAEQRRWIISHTLRGPKVG